MPDSDSRTAAPLTFQHPSPRPDWLASGDKEAILDPGLPIVDPHHHLWVRDGQQYYLDELLEDVGRGHNIVATVFAQCAWAYRTEGPEELRPVGETEFVTAIGEEADRRGAHAKICAGIVGYADLTLGDRVEAVLEAHVAAAHGRFRGIRHLTARDEGFWGGIQPPPPARIMGSAPFRAGFARLGTLGMSYDAWLYHPQIPELTELARAFPGTTIVLDHCGGPLGVGPYAGKCDVVFADWRASMRALADCPNVAVKVGGLGMLVIGFGHFERPRPPNSQELAAAWRPYVETCIELFGPSRCMFESNFPVDKGSFSYVSMWNAFKRLTESASAEDRARLFSRTAAEVYRIVI